MNSATEKQRTIQGRVVSNKMDKTVTVLVERRVQHPIYGKYISRSTKLFVHDPENQCQEGDVVSVISCRPISKNKTWKLVQIIESGNK